MLNQAILVGKVQSVSNLASNILTITLAVVRNFKEPDSDVFQTDYISVYVDAELAKHSKDYIQVDATLAVKARLIQPKNAVAPSLIAEKLSFINAPSNDEESEEK